jgi:REP element-mobilizing transposase RayT
MIRGIEGRRIFLCDVDRFDFLKRLDTLVPELAFRCFGWVLMPNHVHLAVQSGPIRLSRLMARLNTGYARSFNLRHRRQGYLFQNRFRSRIVASEADLLAVIAYICRNPLEAGMARFIPELLRWPWSGLSALTGARRARPFEAVGATLALFGDDPEMARHNLLRFVWPSHNEAIASHALDRHANPSRAPSCGDRILEQVLGVSGGAAKGRGTARTRLRDLIESVCRQLGVEASDLDPRQRTEEASRARAVIAYLAVVECRISGRQVAEALGVSPSAISHSLERGRVALAKNAIVLP